MRWLFCFQNIQEQSVYCKNRPEMLRKNLLELTPHLDEYILVTR